MKTRALSDRSTQTIFATISGERHSANSTAMRAVVGFAFALMLALASTASAATFTVTKTADTNDGVCDADCSLREAIVAANTAATNDIIEFMGGVFDISQNINLTNGELSIVSAGSLVINGPGATLLRINIPVDARHFSILGSAVVTINRVTIYGRREAGFGGGIYVFFGSLNLNDSVITNNYGQHGGGIENRSGQVHVNNSIISGNATSAGGGGILNSGDLLDITNSTVSNNSATDSGGGISNVNGGDINLTNVTVSNNATTSGSGVGAGVNNTPGAGIVIVRNSIIADNTGPVSPDFSGSLTSQGYNLIENTTGTTITGTTTGNILGLDPQLVPLRNNGGTTNTVALQPTSPAIDGGDPTTFPATDQRGVVRPQDGDLNGSALPDIGAYERQVTTFMVTKSEDTNDGLCNSDCSLREAILAANVATMPDRVVVFEPILFATPRTIALTLGELRIDSGSGTVFVKGTGTQLLTISANNQSRVLFVNDPSIAAIQNLTIANGFNGVGLAAGGGILNNGRFVVDRVVIQGNNAAQGAGICNNGIGVLTIIDSTISSNVSTSQGGGIYNFLGGSVDIRRSSIYENVANNNGGGIANGGFMQLENVTVSSNSSNQDGGGIYYVNLFTSLTLINVTVTKNFAQGTGGGIYAASQLSSRNSIIAGNMNLSPNYAPDFEGSFFSNGYNLIGNTFRTGIAGNTTGNILNINPRIDLVLRENGGLTKTHALLYGSAAVDKASAVSGMSIDQRSRNRPNDIPTIPNASGGDGSDIGGFERQPNDTVLAAAPFDFDGDGKTDVSIFRPGPGEWWYQRSSDSQVPALQFGAGTDRITPGDFTGDGKTDFAFWRPLTGFWYVLRSEDFSFFAFPFGTTGDIPAPADYDGDGKADAAVFRPSTATWFILRSGDGGVTIASFGTNGDAPVTADYDGDGKADIAIFRPAGANGAEWWYSKSSDGQTAALQFGASTDKAVPGDYTGDGKADVAFWRPSNGFWFILRSEDFSFFSFPFGTTDDIPAPGDYDGDGKFDATVFRPAGATWFVNRSTAGVLIQQFGAAGDIPVPNAFVP